jgi:hypothetical protein
MRQKLIEKIWDQQNIKEYSLNYLIYSIIVIFSFETYSKFEGGSFKAGAGIQNARVYEEIVDLGNGSVKIIGPKLNTKSGIFPILAYSNKICQAFGYLGGSPSEIELEISDDVDVLYLYTTIRSKDYSNIDPDNHISVSYNFKKTMGSVQRYHFHYAKSVVCSNLRNILGQF